MWYVWGKGLARIGIMKIGIVTLVSDNYGNKFQNYAVEQLLKPYGEVETFAVESFDKRITSVNKIKTKDKLNFNYIKCFLRSRMMSKYDLNNTNRSIFASIIYALFNHRKLMALKVRRGQRFKEYQDNYLHVSKNIITRESCRNDEWLKQYDCFFCGSDQIWNPTYATTSELAFVSFAGKRTVALAPSFGVSAIPEDVQELYREWIDGIRFLSVREKEGQKIIENLTGRNAELLLDPTMTLDVKKWHECAKKPTNLPDRYVLCYFLGQVNATYKKSIESYAKNKGLKIVKLFDIECPDYYTYDPNEVLYSIMCAEYVLTDSFHGSVFSILFKKNFFVFDRDGGMSMSSRIDTLLEKFNLKNRKFNKTEEDISISKWDEIENILKEERNHTMRYIENSISKIRMKEEENEV